LLTRDRLARTTFELVDQEGPAALTIGRLAKELGVGPMTIYGYAPSKDAIVAMLPDLLLEHVPPVDMDKSWQDALEEVFVSVYRSFLDHRYVTQAIAESPVFGPAQAKIIEGVLVRLERAGFSDREAFELQRTLATYTLGFAMFAVVEAQAGADRQRATWTHDLDDGDFPHVARVSGLFGAEVSEQQYLAGLHRILGS
jgi:AcrR family transcriptional regulator